MKEKGTVPSDWLLANGSNGGPKADGNGAVHDSAEWSRVLGPPPKPRRRPVRRPTVPELRARIAELERRVAAASRSGETEVEQRAAVDQPKPRPTAGPAAPVQQSQKVPQNGENLPKPPSIASHPFGAQAGLVEQRIRLIEGRILSSTSRIQELLRGENGDAHP